MSYEEIVLDNSILDIDSWLPEDVFAEIAEIVFDIKKSALSNFSLPTSQDANYEKLINDINEPTKSSKNNKYTLIEHKNNNYKTFKPYEDKGAA